jgi:hypothetical protein
VQRYIFHSDAESIELKYVSGAEGLGVPPVDIESTKGYRQDGVTVHGVDYQPRVFTLSFGIAGKNFLAAADERRKVARFFADKKPKKFVYMRDNFTAYLYPVYLMGGFETPIASSRLMPSVVQFMAGDPYFKNDIPSTSAAIEEPLLEWPEDGLELVEGGLELSTSTTRLSVKNNGDVQSDAIIRFIGPAVTPYIENLTTGERIEVDRTLDEGEVLEINSMTGRVDIIEDDERHNAFNFISDESEFITLAPGQNEIEFGSAGGALGYIEIRGIERYAGI